MLMGTYWQLRKGVSGARGDDTRGLKGAVLDWVTPQGQTLSPPLTRNRKDDRGFKHERTGALLCPIDLDWSNAEYVIALVPSCAALIFHRTKEKLKSGTITVCGDQWPMMLYSGLYDPLDPWNGLLRNYILVRVSRHSYHMAFQKISFIIKGVQAYLYIAEFS